MNTYRKTTVLALDSRATFGHAVALKVIDRFDLDAEIRYESTNLKVCCSLTRGNGDIAIVPLENNSQSAGLVPDWLTWCEKESSQEEPRCEIIGELVVSISQCLMAKPGIEEKDIRRVLSHERAIRQCKMVLSELRAPITEVNSTGEAARLVSLSSVEDGLAAIGPASGASEFGLRVLRKSAEDSPGNVTRFGILRRKRIDAFIRTSNVVLGNERKRVITRFALPNVEGALHGVTEVLLKHKANMTSLQALPQGVPFSYSYEFYLEFEIAHDMADDCIQAMKSVTEGLKIFGNFFIGEKKVQHLG